MPTYEYECLECRKRFDVFQSINDDPIRECVSCKGKVRKIFGTAGIIFKGSGFYVTDYRNKSSAGKSEAKDSSSAPESCAACAAGSD